MAEKVNCIFLVYSISMGKKGCLLGHKWSCFDDASYCGNVCPNYKPEVSSK